MNVITWNDISEYVAAGNLDTVTIGENLDSITLNVVYIGVSNGVQSNAEISLECLNCCYFDFRRGDDHEPGSGLILEAYLRTESGLITALHNHQLDSTAGCLCLEAGGMSVYHLEIVGEISLNILCGDIVVKATPHNTGRV